MQVLGLETSALPSSWSWWDQGEERRSVELEGQPSATLVDSLQQHLPEAARPGLILVGVGPGSFSGIRAAIATARGLAFGWDAEVRPVLSTHAVALPLAHEPRLGIFCDARRGKIFFTAYESGVMARPPSLIDPADVEALVSGCTRAVSTDGLDGVPEAVRPQARDLVAWALRHPDDAGLPLEPVYLHAPMPEVPVS